MARLSPYLEESLFSLDDEEWTNVAFSDKDWAILDRLRKSNSDLDAIYAELCIGYINANTSRVNNLYALDRKISDEIFNNKEESLNLVGDIDEKDVQSMYMFRLLCALHSEAKDEMLSAFSSARHSGWLKRRFLYPFIFYYVNLPSDKSLDLYLSHAIPAGHTNVAERSTISFLLKDEICRSESVAFKCFIALLCHPFDACEILLNHCEQKVAEDGSLGDLEQHICNALVKVVPVHRRRISAAFTDLRATKFNANPEPGEFEYPDGDGPLREFLSAYLSLNPFTFDSNNLPSKSLQSLGRIRAAKYPDVIDFTNVLSIIQTYHFTTAGKILEALFTSLYLLHRRESFYEKREIYRLSALAGGFCQLLATSPRGYEIAKQFAPPEFLNGISALTESGELKEDRTWLNHIHWPLSIMESEGKLQPWMNRIQEHIRITPSYLTGIDWESFDQVLHAVRIRPFLGSPAGIYVLLLQYIEASRKGTNALRLAMEPVARSHQNSNEFLRWLSDNYGESSVGFVRYVLTPDMLLYLGLEKNYPAALTHRMRSIEECARQFGMSTEFLSEADLINEQKSYAASLLSINVGANQFSVSWEIFKKDVLLRNGDVFKAYVAFNEGAESNILLSHAKRETAFTFSNGSPAQYSIANREWPLVNLILVAIDTFLDHPSQGIESILAIRIRHHRLMRIFYQQMEITMSANMIYPSASDRRYFIPKYKKSLTASVQSWIDSRMHQLTPTHKNGLFNFIPDQAELLGLLRSVESIRDLDVVLDVIVGWLKDRLSAQLSEAIRSINSELRINVESALELETKNQTIDHPAVSSIPEINRVMRSAIGKAIECANDWFTVCEADENSISASDLWAAITERYEMEIDGKQIRMDPFPANAQFKIERDDVRLTYDLWCEVVENAIEHAHVDTPRLRISLRFNGENALMTFSSTASLAQNRDWTIKGHPYKSISDSLFREGNSGISKMASLCASIMKTEVDVSARRRKGFFHLHVPVPAKRP